MTGHRDAVSGVSEIRVEPQPSGLEAVYLVETRSPEEAGEVARLFEELETRLQVRQLSDGKLMSFVVQAHESDSDLLDEVGDILTSSYPLVVTQRSFDPLIHRIVSELCEDTESELLPVPLCNICGKIDPFPHTVVRLSGDDGRTLVSRSYCSSCIAKVAVPSNKEFVRSLLAADQNDFREIQAADLVRHPSRRRPLRFRIK